MSQAKDFLRYLAATRGLDEALVRHLAAAVKSAKDGATLPAGV